LTKLLLGYILGEFEARWVIFFHKNVWPFWAFEYHCQLVVSQSMALGGYPVSVNAGASACLQNASKDFFPIENQVDTSQFYNLKIFFRKKWRKRWKFD
jgi:hypothetical protein